MNRMLTLIAGLALVGTLGAASVEAQGFGITIRKKGGNKSVKIEVGGKDDCHDHCKPARKKYKTVKVWVDDYEWVEEHVDVPGYYETQHKDVWVPGCYRTVTREVWVPGQYVTVTEQRRDRCGCIQEVQVKKWVPGHYEDRECQEWVPGHYECQEVQVWVPGRCETKKVYKKVGGHWETRRVECN